MPDMPDMIRMWGGNTRKEEMEVDESEMKSMVQQEPQRAGKGQETKKQKTI